MEQSCRYGNELTGPTEVNKFNPKKEHILYRKTV